MKNVLKQVLIVAFVLAINMGAHAQESFGLLPLTPEMEQKLNEIPPLQLSKESLATPLPFMVDNSLQPYFRQVFNQFGGSCVHASEIGYVFTYEVNRQRGVHFNKYDSTTFFAPGYTWNFCNEGTNKGTPVTSGFDIAEKMGVVNTKDYGGMYSDVRKWMTGYDKYAHALSNRVESQFMFNETATTHGLERLKHYLSDHGEGAEIGGIVTFITYMCNFSDTVKLSGSSYDAGAYVLTDMEFKPNGDTLAHEMTIVGYNDSIKIDINGDGQFTNTIDINGDNLVTMRDWEIGAFKVANSWGPNWLDNTDGNRGFIYWPYRLLAPNDSGNHSIVNNWTYGINVTTNFQPKIVLQTKINYPQRSTVVWHFGVSHSLNSAQPVIASRRQFIKGGILPMQGISNEPLEMITNYSNQTGYASWSKRIFLKIYTEGEPDGELIEYSIKSIDGTTSHIGGEVLNRPLTSEPNTDFIIIDYDYISSIFTDNVLINEDFTINKHVTIKNSSSIKFRNADISFTANSSIDVLLNSDLIIDGNVTFSSNAENNGIFLSGDLIIGANDVLTMEPGVLLSGTSLSGKVIVEGTLRLSNQQLSNLEIEVKNGGKLIITDHVSMQNNTSLVLRSGAMVEGDVNANTLNLSYTQCTIESGVTFNNLTHTGVGGVFFTHYDPFSLEHAYFINTNFNANLIFGNINVQNCTFNGSELHLDQIYPHAGYCTVKNNTFTNTLAQEVLRIDDFKSFVVSDNVFENNMGTAIAIYNSGKPAIRGKLIENNLIHSNLNNGAAKGILTYASVVDIRNNTIFDNDYGIALYHNSNVSICGDKNSIEKEIYQMIYNNVYNQLFAGNNSFPWQFELNVLRENNSAYPRVQSTSKTPPSPYNIAYNCWGNNFDPTTDLSPYNMFVYEPVWDCGLNPGALISNEPMVAYKDVISLLEENQPEAAMVAFKNIVNTWPQSAFAAEAMKSMPEYTSDLQALQTYFATNTHIQQSEELKKLAKYLTAECHIKDGAYQSALTIYEGIIDNPPTMEDSIYAQIDAGRVQYLMEQEGNKAPVTFKYQHMIPKTHAAFTQNRKTLLDKLQGVKTEVEKPIDTEPVTDGESPTQSFKLYPNPVSDMLNVEFAAKAQGNATLTVYNSTGQVVYTATETMNKNENNSYNINTKELEQGVYVLQISTNDTQIRSRRFVISR